MQISPHLNPAIFDKPINYINKSTDDARLKEQTDAFEALILKFMLDSALKLDNPLLPKAAGSEIYNAMYKESIANAVSGNFGYSELLFSYLKDLQKNPQDSAPKSQNLAQNPQILRQNPQRSAYESRNLAQNPQRSVYDSQNLAQKYSQNLSQNPPKDA